MDVFYHWKDINEDLKAQRIGYLRANVDRAKEFQNGSPDYIWVFKTPRGSKGRVQLHARLRWSDTPIGPVARRVGETYLYYDAAHSESITFSDPNEASATDAATTWVRLHLPTAINANFQGANGQHALRGATVAEIKLLARSFHTAPFTQSHPVAPVAAAPSSHAPMTPVTPA